MKRALGVLIIWAGSVSAGQLCAPVEYAELKDMKAGQLEALYCVDQRLVAIETERVHKLSAEGLMSASAGNQSVRDRTECWNQMAKVSTILDGAGRPKDPLCK